MFRGGGEPDSFGGNELVHLVPRRIRRQVEKDRLYRLNRWLPLVKWLLAVPQYLLAGALVGAGNAVASGTDNDRGFAYSGPSLIGASVLIAAIALLFTARYPPACTTWWSESIGGAIGWWCRWR